MRTAIIGMACLFPGAPDLGRFWRNIVDGVDSIGDVPAARWDPQFHDPASSAVDRFYCRRGGFVDEHAWFDPLPFGVVPNEVASAEPDQLLALQIGRQALADAGYAERPFARQRSGVIIGRGNYVSAGVLRLEQRVRLLPQLRQTLVDLFPDLPASALDAAQARLEAACGHHGPDTAAGLIPNLIASRLANRLDLRGPAFTVDAACASALLALEQAVAALHGGQADLMLVGGAHLSHDLTFWSTFCQLGALSRSGTIRPLAADADGLLPSEGIGMVVLKRLADAQADGDRVYAVIEGTGSASDGRTGSLVAPSADGQRLALQRAWQGLPFGRELIGLLEAHGTGTPAGDAAELDTVADFFGPADGAAPRPVIGSVKSMIGHAMPAAGMAGLIKAALAVHHGVLPPTLHCEQPHPRLADTRFRTLARSEPWPAAAAERVAALNAFGFGGINAHVVLRGMATARAAVAGPTPRPLLLLSADNPQQLLQRLDRGEHDEQPGPGNCRLVLADPDPARRAMAREAVAGGRAWSGRRGLWFSPQGLLSGGGRLAWLFPGVDGTGEAAQPLLQQVLALLDAQRRGFQALAALGLRADAMAGHSVGEWSAMACAGVLDAGWSQRIHHALAQGAHAAPTFPDLPYLAANCSAEVLQQAMAGLDPLVLSHDNCPHQAIACGPAPALAELAARLRARGIVAHWLPFVSGFHSPAFAAHLGWYRDLFGSTTLAAPDTPLWSATTAQPLPADPHELRRLALAQLVQPVRFGPMIDAMHQAGCRVFVQIGDGALTGFVSDTLAGRPHRAWSLPAEPGDAQAALQGLCAALWVEGAEFDTTLLRGRPASAQRLALGVPLLRVAPLDDVALAAPAIVGDDPLAQAVRSTLADIHGAAREVAAVWQRHRATPPLPPPWREQRRLDLDTTVPEVRDHGLYPQAEGWPILADRHPVLPMTMAVQMLRQALEEAWPGRVVVEVCQVQAYHWLALAEPLTVELVFTPVAADQVDAEISGYVKARLVLASSHAAADDGPCAALQQPRPAAVDAQALYRQRWMFHGPAYQGVLALGPIGDNGIDGTLQVPWGRGGLLDSMGQLAGYWVMEQPRDCLAMPVGVDRIRFFGPEPAPGEPLQCTVRIEQLDTLSCRSRLRLRDATGRLRVAIDGWQTRRYPMERAHWLCCKDASQRLLSRPLGPQVMLFEDTHDSANVREYLARRYLTASERRVHDALSPRRRRPWLNGRIAAKDAVRAWLRRQHGIDGLFPQQIVIDNDAGGAPQVRGLHTDAVPPTLRLSLTHKDRLAAAIVDERPVGIDIERIEARSESFGSAVFSAAERRCLAADGEPEALALTRGWVAKEVAAKAAGTGLAGLLRQPPIDGREGARLRSGSLVIETQVLDQHLIGWSLP